MGCLTVTFLYLLVIIGLSYSAPTRKGSYESRVKSWETNFQKTKFLTCSFSPQKVRRAEIIRSAKAKAYPSKLKSSDDLAAARIVNMYTKPYPCFYGELNKQLRENSLSTTFREYSVLLNEAIDMLSRKLNGGIFRPNTYRAVYRGTGRCDEITKKGRTILKAFTSTSVDPKVPFGSFSCSIFIYFKNVKGLDVSKLSDIPGEKEVLLKSNYPIDVTEFITDKNEIAKQIRKLSKKIDPKDVNLFVKAKSV